MKTFRGWTVQAGHPDEPRSDDADPAAAPRGQGDGTLTWTSPLGAVFETRPERRWPVVATDPVAAARSVDRRRARAGARDAGARTACTSEDTAGDGPRDTESTSGRVSRARTASCTPTWLTDPGALPPF